MVKVLFFAKIKEDLQCDQDTLEWSSELNSVMDIKCVLSQRGDLWQESLSSCLCAVNHSMAQDSHAIKDGDEIAFFPPVTGG